MNFWTFSFKHFKNMIALSGGKMRVAVLLLYLTAYRILSVLDTLC